MKIMKKISKRFIAVLCVATVLCSVVPANKLERVQATDTSTEKTVMVQKLTKGTVTPGQGTTEYSMDGYVFGGYYDDYDGDLDGDDVANAETEKFRTPITGEARAASAENPIYIRWVPKEVMKVRAQVGQDEYKKVLTSCDSKDAASNLDLSTDGETSEDKQEGTASIKYKQTSTYKTLMTLVLASPKDVSGYKYFSCKIKIDGDLAISDTNKDGVTDANDNHLLIRLCSTTETGSNYLEFRLTQNELNEYKIDETSGWYDLKLPFAEAEAIDGSYAAGTLTKILLMRAAGGNDNDITLWVDDICVQNENPGVLLFDGDSMKAPNLTSVNNKNALTIVTEPSVGGTGTNIITSAKGEVKEGTAALKAQCFYSTKYDYRMQSNICMSDANKLDISTYMDTGSLHLWLYIHHANYLTGDVSVILSSDGTSMTQTVTHTVNETDLHDGWNELYLPLRNFSSNEFDQTAVNGIRVHCAKAAAADTYKNQYMIVDDVRIVDNVLQVTDCDSIGDITFGQKVSVTENAKQGGGAFERIRTDTYKTLLKMTLPSSVDFTSHKGKNGCLHFWMYLSDLSGLGENLHVDIDSDVNASTKTRYSIPVTYLQTGWNEIYLNLDKPTTPSTTSWSEIVLMQIVTGVAGACTIRLDDITLVPGTKETAAVRFVSTVDSLNYKNVGFTIKQSYSKNALVTETTTVYKEFYAIGKTGQPDTFGPSDVSGISCSDYMYGATVVNLPNRLWNAVFTVTPYWVTQDGTTVTGSAQTYTINQLMNATRQLLTNATE